MFKSIRENSKQSMRQLARHTGLSNSSVHRHTQAMARRDRHPEAWVWDTPEGRNWLIRLVVATLFMFGLKRGVGAALHQKSGQYADSSVNKTFLASF